ncbi:hypothetical protein BD626DRAFT_478192 [Schizophyllum amplum]|uniref:Uncharacterized protein n=1 Tax=Schizophyllum amplum TaxID=97359 RepID=A0A550D0V6_9AGAR|nr:hypothetical protein BD626DRAFT_478192 [Auriculariopsis ampla]
MQGRILRSILLPIQTAHTSDFALFPSTTPSPSHEPASIRRQQIPTRENSHSRREQLPLGGNNTATMTRDRQAEGTNDVVHAASRNRPR